MTEKIIQQQFSKRIYEDRNISRKYNLDNIGERFSKVLSKCAFLVTISVKMLGMKMHNASIQR